MRHRDRSAARGPAAARETRFGGAVFALDFFDEVVRKAFFVRRGAVGALAFLVFLVACFSRAPSGAALFGAQARLLLAVVLVATPSVFAQALVRHRRAHALEVLMTTPLTPGRLLRELWLSRLALLAAYVLPVVPFLGITLLMGGVTVTQLLAFGALLALSIVWTAAVSMAAGALVADVTSATRVAYGVVALLLMLPHVVAPGLAQVGLGAAADTITWFSPFSLLARIEDVATVGAATTIGLATFAGFACVVAGLAVMAALRGIRPGRRRTESVGRLTRAGRRRLAQSVLVRAPMAWLGLAHTLGRGASAMALILFAGIVLAESVFVHRLVGLYAVAGEPFGFWALGANPWAPLVARTWHGAYVAGSLGLALLLVVVGSATALHRELESNSLDLLFASPLTNEATARGLFLASTVAGLPFWCLSVLHVLVGWLGGSVSTFGALLYVPASLVVGALVSALAFEEGLRHEDPRRATLGAMKELARSGLFRLLTIALISIVLVLPISVSLIPGTGLRGVILIQHASWSFFPPFLALGPALVPDELGAWGWPKLGLLVGLLYAWRWLRRLLRDGIPRRFVLKREHRYLSRALYRREPGGSAPARAPSRSRKRSGYRDR